MSCVEHSNPHSPIIQHFDRLVRDRTQGLEEDVRITNKKIGHVERTEIDSNTKLTTLEASVATVNTTLDGIERHLDEMARASHHGSEMDDHDYVGDSEDDADQRRLCFNRHGMAHRRPRREVRNNDDSFGKIKFTIPAFDGKYDPDAYLSCELVVDQKFACHDVPEDKRVRAATSEFTDFAYVWWSEYRCTHIHALPPTWDDLK
jgi:hypothetical protein